MALEEGGFAEVEGGFVGAVFDFDADVVLVADVGEDGEKLAPVHVAHAGELGGVVFAGVGEDADFVEAMAVEADVFGVDVEEAVFEFAHRVEVVHVLPDHVRGVIVEAEAGGAEVVEEATPEFGAGGDVFAAGPFVAAEEHGAVFDADANAVAFREFDEGLPDFEEARPVVVDGFGPVAADEGVDGFQAEEGCGLNDLAEVGGRKVGFFAVGRERIGVVAEGADLDFGVGHEGADLVGFGGGEIGDIDVRDAGVAALGLADGPAHELDAGVAGLGGEGGDFGEGEVGEDGGDEAEFHGRVRGSGFRNAECGVRSAECGVRNAELG